MIDHTKIATYLAQVNLTHGVGIDAHNACSIAALNLALSGNLTDKDTTQCMCPVIRSWVIRVQDRMPLDMMSQDDEHGARWREALPFVAGSRDPSKEKARLAIIMAWMWQALGGDTVPEGVPESAKSAWAVMLKERTPDAAYAAYAAAYDAAYAAAAHAADAAAYAAHAAAHAAAYDAAAHAADAAAYAAADAKAWRTFDPASLLHKLVTA
jgi:hypothetical protein